MVDEPDISCNTPGSPETTVKHLVLSGGGVSGFTFYGILRETHRDGLWKLENIETMYGTSIGAALAVILALGYEWDILDTYLIKRPWQNIFKIDLYSLLNVFDKKGIFDIKIFEEMMGPLFAGMEIPLDITMREFYEKTGKEIHMFSTELNSMRPVDISYKTHPDWKVVQGIYCSSTLPIVFEPYMETEESTGIKKCYVDGGFFINYPLENCIQDTGAQLDEILAVNKLQNTSDIPIGTESTFFDYILIAFNRLFEIVLNQYQGLETVKIPHEYTIVDGAITLQSIIDTALSMDERIRLIQMGVDIMRGTKVPLRTASPPPFIILRGTKVPRDTAVTDPE
jgi:predicted acylesterase/phospholipase RssA